MQAIILTGGQGTRLRPLTLYTSKPLLPIVNLPFLSYPLALLRKNGIREVVLCTAGSDKPYQKLMAMEKKNGTKLICSMEKKELGTAGAIRNAEKFIDSFPFFVFNGDVLSDYPIGKMLDFHLRMKAHATVALIEVENPLAYGLVELQKSSKIQRFLEKPQKIAGLKRPFWINAGIYILEKELLHLIPHRRKCSIEREVFPLCLKKGLALCGFKPRPSPFWLDVGTPERYLAAQLFLLKNGWNRFGLRGKPRRIGESSSIGKNTFLGRDVVVGKGCSIGNYVHIKRSILLDKVVVEDFAEIENCIVGNNVRIGHHSSLKGLTIIGDYSVITPYTQVRGFTPTPIQV